MFRVLSMGFVLVALMPNLKTYALDFALGAEAIGYGIVSLVSNHYNGFGGFY